MELIFLRLKKAQKTCWSLFFFESQKSSKQKWILFYFFIFEPNRFKEHSFDFLQATKAQKT